MRKWVLWAPVLMVGTMLFWTVALGLGLGNLALLAVSSIEDGGYQPLSVRTVQEAVPIVVQPDWAEVPGQAELSVQLPEAPAAAAGLGDRAGRQDGDATQDPSQDQGPGKTAF